MTQNDLLVDEIPLEEKTDVVLVMLNRDLLESVIKNLDFNKINLINLIMDRDPEEPVPIVPKQVFYQLGEDQIPLKTFAQVHLVIHDYKKSVWMICGCDNSDDAFRMKNLLTIGGVPEDNILNFNIAPQISETWLANLRYVEEYGADFFATGNEYIQVGLNMKFIPCAQENVACGGVNLAAPNQTLQQSYLIAKHVFAHVAPGTIKFVLIGLMPYSSYYATAADFLNCTQNLLYDFAFDEPTSRDELLLSLINDECKDNFKKIFSNVSAEQADLNFDDIKSNFNRTFSVGAIEAWDDVPQNLSLDNFDNNIQIFNDYATLKDYIELCLANGAKPIGVVLPFTPAARKSFDRKLVAAFRNMIRRLVENCDFICVNMFGLNLNYDSFCDMTHLNATGQSFVSSLLALKLQAKDILPVESFCDMTYAYFNNLSEVVSAREYNALMERVLEASARKIRRKEKIKLAFVLHEPRQWCGDELYNLFARDERFETAFFLCTRITGAFDNELFKKNFSISVKQLTAHIPNISVPENRDTPVPPQDVIIYFTPFPGTLPVDLRPENLTARVLITHVPYAFDISIRSKDYYNRLMFRVAWKVFFSSVIGRKTYAEYNSVGMPRGVYSGYPRMDLFFKRDLQFNFKWKMIRPDAKKIIWAPNGTINYDVKYSTFQWNYRFMYEFAKAHPETSWVVKPHSALFKMAVKEKIFPSVAAFEEYLRAWDALPNAQVYLGAYYQDIFATSDGMIHDWDTFIGEYQYVDKPMIFLTRDTQKFNKLGKKILRVSYLVDGQDLDAIAATIQQVIIDGDDYKAVERKDIFDKYLDYPTVNGMSAGEFIYHSIADKFEEASE